MFVRAFLPQLDSRMSKYVRALKSGGNFVSFIGWQRTELGGPTVSEDDVYLFRRQARLGGRWRNLLALVAWNFYVIRTLFKNRRALDLVHAVDLDSGLAAYTFCRLFGKPFVFDIYDHYADTRSLKGFARTVISAVERYLASHANLTLLADDSRYRQHELKPAANSMVIENVPADMFDGKPIEPSSAETIRVGFFGVLEAQHRGLENLLEAFSGRDGIELHFAGYGPLNERINAAAAKYRNVFHHGALTYEEGLRMQSTMHCTVGFYYLSVPNHRYAAPNKYYEHLMLGRPLITTRGTPPGDRVERDQTGWALGEDIPALEQWWESVSIEQLAVRGLRARSAWEANYRDYFATMLIGRYQNALSNLVDA